MNFEPCQTTATITGDVKFGETKEKLTPWMDIPVRVTDPNGTSMDIRHRIFLAAGNIEGTAGEILDKNLSTIDVGWGAVIDIDTLFVQPDLWLGKTYPVRVFKREGSKYFQVEFDGAGPGGGNEPPLAAEKVNSLAAKMKAARSGRSTQSEMGY